MKTQDNIFVCLNVTDTMAIEINFEDLDGLILFCYVSIICFRDSSLCCAVLYRCASFLH